MKPIVKCNICGKKIDISNEGILSKVNLDKNEFVCSDTCSNKSNEKNFPIKKFKYALEIKERETGEPLYGSILDEKGLKKVLKNGLGWKGID